MLASHNAKHVDDIKRAIQLEIAHANWAKSEPPPSPRSPTVAARRASNVGRIEYGIDVRLSTLQRYVEALGADSRIHAVFDDADISRSSHSRLDDREGGGGGRHAHEI